MIYLKDWVIGFQGDVPPNTSITPNDGIKKIADGAFSHCPNITSVTLPENIVSLGNSAFENCSNLTDIYYYTHDLSDFKKAFKGCAFKNITLHISKDLILQDGKIALQEECYSCSKRVKEHCKWIQFHEISPIIAQVSSVSLPQTIYLFEEQAHSLSPKIRPSYATEKELIWSSSNEEVAVVNSKGKVIPLSHGKSIITATAKDGSGVNASCEVIVRKPVRKIQLNQTSVKLIEGKTLMLTANVLPNDADNISFTWNTTDDDIAMILGNGRIVGVSPGTATITATANDGSGVIATCEVTVVGK